jgi:hypothetical protein
MRRRPIIRSSSARPRPILARQEEDSTSTASGFRFQFPRGSRIQIPLATSVPSPSSPRARRRLSISSAPAPAQIQVPPSSRRLPLSLVSCRRARRTARSPRRAVSAGTFRGAAKSGVRDVRSFGSGLLRFVVAVACSSGCLISRSDSSV